MFREAGPAFFLHTMNWISTLLWDTNHVRKVTWIATYLIIWMGEFCMSFNYIRLVLGNTNLLHTPAFQVIALVYTNSRFWQIASVLSGSVYSCSADCCACDIHDHSVLKVQESLCRLAHHIFLGCCKWNWCYPVDEAFWELLSSQVLDRKHKLFYYYLLFFFFFICNVALEEDWRKFIMKGLY